MPLKVYLDAYPSGDFRAMPAKGAGLAILKWVTSSLANPRPGLPVVMGVICVSSAADGEPLALLDVRSVTALARVRWPRSRPRSWLARTRRQSASLAAGCTAPGPGAAWPRPSTAPASASTRTRRRPDGSPASLAGGGGPARCARVRRRHLRDPGVEPVIGERDLRPGLHLNMLGADGPQGRGRARRDRALRAVLRRLEQASHGGELTGAVAAGLVERAQVTEPATCSPARRLAARSPTRSPPSDSTGLAIQTSRSALPCSEAEGCWPRARRQGPL